MISLLTSYLDKLNIFKSSKSQHMSLKIKRPSTKSRVSFSYKELWLRIGFTFLVVLLYRFGSHVPIPGLNAAVLSEIVTKSAGGVLSMLNTFSGGSIERATIFMFSLSPYITASIMIQIGTTMSPTLQALKKDGESGQKKRNQYTRYLALILTVLHSYALAVLLEGRFSDTGLPAVMMPGIFFRISTVLSLTAGTFFLIWISEQINERGIGQGSSIIIYTGIVASLPVSIHKISIFLNKGLIGWKIISFDIVLVLSLMLFATLIEQTFRSVNVIYPRGQLHVMNNIPVPTQIPVKLNVAGVMAPIMANSFLDIPSFLSTFLPTLSNFVMSNTFYFISFGTLIFALAFVTAPMSLDPEETAQDLQRNNGFLEGVRPGKDTIKFFEYLLNRLACFSGLYLILMCLLPDIFIKRSGLQVFFGGTSMLILVGVTYEITTQIEGYRLNMQYGKKLCKTFTKH